jgi:hypothetical protein
MADRQSNVPTKHATKPFGHSNAATRYHGRTERQTKAEEMAIQIQKKFHRNETNEFKYPFNAIEDSDR